MRSRHFVLICLFVTLQQGICDFEVLSNEDKIVSAGSYHTCALERRPGIEIGGGIKCWGDNRKGQTSSPPGIHRQVSSGKFFSCAISAEDKISCWGAMQGVLPDGKFSQLSVGQSHACALQRSGRLKCWGTNTFKESLPPDHLYTQVSCGQSTSCGIRLNGSVECWGKEHNGEVKPPDSKLKQISVGFERHSCGITLGGDIKCWGSNTHGQSIQREGPFIHVSSGVRSTCGIHANYTIECWGQSRQSIPSGTSETNSTKYEHVTMGKDHVCALTQDGKLQCWNSGHDVGAHVVPLGFVAAKR